MKSRKGRRKQNQSPESAYEDNGRNLLAKERRKRRDRRKENLELEERQWLLAEMPGLTPDRHS